jgi:hypothetical protein
MVVAQGVAREQNEWLGLVLEQQVTVEYSSFIRINTSNEARPYQVLHL